MCLRGATFAMLNKEALYVSWTLGLCTVCCIPYIGSLYFSIYWKCGADAWLYSPFQLFKADDLRWCFLFSSWILGQKYFGRWDALNWVLSPEGSKIKLAPHK